MRKFTIPKTSIVCLLVASATCGGDSTAPASTAPPPATVNVPTVNGVSPSLTVAVSAQTLTVTGVNFPASPTLVLSSPSGVDVKLSGTSLSGVASTSLTAIVVLNAPGSWRAQVTGGSVAPAAAFAFSVAGSPAPDVASISPSVAPGISGSNTVYTIAGSNFQSGASVVVLAYTGSIGALDKSAIISTTSTSIRFEFGAGGVGPLDFAVVNPDGQWSAHTVRVEFGGPLSKPAVLSISPTAAGTSAAAQVLSVTTSGTDSSTTFGLVNPTATGVVTGFAMTSPGIYKLSGILNTTGTWRLYVRNADGGESILPFTVGPGLANPIAAPVIDSILPVSITASDAEQPITIFGKNFQAGATANFVSANTSYAARVISTTASQIAASAAISGSSSMVVSVRSADGSPSNSKTITVRPPVPFKVAPTVSGVSTVSGPSLSPQIFTVTGSGFDATGYYLLTPPPADLSSADFSPSATTVISSTKLSARDYFDRPGVWRIQVITSAGASNMFSFTVPASTETAPTITSVDSIYLSVPRIADVRIQGTNFKPGLWIRVVFDDSVKFNITAVDSMTSTTIWLKSVALESGRIQVQNPTGPRSNIARLNVQPDPPYVSFGSTLNASSAPATATITGSNFKPGLTVTLLDPNRAPRSFTGLMTTTNSIHLTAAFDTPGFWRVIVTNPDGHVSGPDGGFTVRASPSAPAPAVSGVTPASPTVSADPQTLTITGTGFVPGAKVGVTPTFPATGGTISGDGVKNLTSTSLQMTTSLYVAGTWTFVVTNPDGQSAQINIRLTGLAQPPSVTAIPQSPFALNSTIPFSVIGTGFAPGATAILTDPTGQQVTLTPISLTNTAMQLYSSFLETGTWTLAIKNVDGQTGNAFSFIVQ